MKNLWAPWRIEYILSEKPGYCIFCENPREGDDRKHLILYRGENVFAVMNKYPYNSGHMMIVPFVHVPDLEGLSAPVLSEMMEAVRTSAGILKRAMRPEGFNIGLNIGKPAGAGIDEHLHIHIVPRWVGDKSFMPVLGEVHVIPEHLLATYDKLYPLFNGK